jgi:hypothetical protein
MNQQTTRKGPAAPNTKQITVNKAFVSKLAWDELDSIERTHVMELVRTLDELRETLKGGPEPFDKPLSFYLKEMRETIKSELPILASKQAK